MSKYKVGATVVGTVTGIEEYGIFVSIDQFYSGLIHISEISDRFVKNINDFVSVGERINVKILYVDEGTGKLKLSIKNINYRLSPKRKKYTIVETSNGFSPLKENLEKWIQEKMAEIQKKQKKT